MAKYRMVRTDFWKNPVVMEEMTPEDKYFYVYLLTNPQTTQTGIYKITKKQMAFDLGYSIESVHALMERFIEHHKLIRYNPETRELAIKNWAKDNLQKGGKPVMDCIISELKEVEDLSLIPYVSEDIHNQDIRSLYDSFCKKQEEDSVRVEKDPSIEELDDTFTTRYTIGGQKEKEKEKENKKEKQQKAFPLNRENHLDKKNPLQSEDVREIVEFWDANGFGFTNMNAKQQLLSWLNDSIFLQPKEMILKAMNIACANNKRKLNYIVGILKNWENESLMTVEEIDSYQEKQKSALKHKPSTEKSPGGRYIPSRCKYDITAGEKD